MVNRLDKFFSDDGGKKEKPEAVNDAAWDHTNIDNFHKWIEDNKLKVDCGKSALAFVVSMGSEVAACACVKWLHANNFSREQVEARASRMTDLCIDVCDRERKNITADCATILATTGSVSHVLMMAFVSYSLIGASIAQDLANETH